MDHLGKVLVNDASLSHPGGENETPAVEPIPSPSRPDKLNCEPVQCQGEGTGTQGRYPNESMETAATTEPIPSTSKGVTVDTHSNSETGTEESSSSGKAEILDVPTLSMGDLLKLHPTPKKVPKKRVPEEAKDDKYQAMRLKNTVSSRNARAKKRKIDEERVALLKKALEENKRLKEEHQRLGNIEENYKTLLSENNILRTLCSIVHRLNQNQ